MSQPTRDHPRSNGASSSDAVVRIDTGVFETMSGPSAGDAESDGSVLARWLETWSGGLP